MNEATKPPLGLAFEEARAPSEPRAASTVIVVRDRPSKSDGSARSVEVFCVRRHQSSAFLGGAIVFPGGKVDDGDRDAAWSDVVDAVSGRSLDFCAGEDEARASAIAAARELIEEAGLLPADIDEETVEAVRAEASGDAPLSAVIRRRGLRLALGSLHPFARWVTPVAEPRRFDARFYLLALPSNQRGRHDDHETTHSFWASPTEVLERFARGEVQLAPPTTRSLELLVDAASVAEALTIADRQDLRPVCPSFVASEPPMLTLPGDPAHPESETIVAGPSRFVLRDGRFVSEDP